MTSDFLDGPDLVDAPTEDSTALTDALFDGDTGSLPSKGRWALTALLRERAVTEDRDPDLWAAICDHQDELASRLHDMYLDLVLDLHNRVAFKRQIRPDGVPYSVLLIDRSYTREATVALVCLREQFHAQRTTGTRRVYITRDALTTEVEVFQRPDETNLTARSKNLGGAIKTLVDQRVLLGSIDEDRWEISPIIETLVTPDSLRHLADWLTRPTSDDAIPSASEVEE
jgi:Domain of unknown function (DUF4194)